MYLFILVQCRPSTPHQPQQDCPKLVASTMSRWLWEIPKEEPPEPLWAACARPLALSQHSWAFWGSEEYPELHFVPIFSCPGTGRN